jgi:hypothetical protein
VRIEGLGKRGIEPGPAQSVNPRWSLVTAWRRLILATGQRRAGRRPRVRAHPTAIGKPEFAATGLLRRYELEPAAAPRGPLLANLFRFGVSNRCGGTICAGAALQFRHRVHYISGASSNRRRSSGGKQPGGPPRILEPQLRVALEDEELVVILRGLPFAFERPLA